jgi:hypothetical protein
MLEVGTHCTLRSSWRRSTVSSSAVVFWTGGRSGAHSMPAAHKWANAAREGLRMVASPRASGT